MKNKGTTIVRIVLGAILLAIGLIGLSGIAASPEYAEPANRFMTALVDTGYMMVIVVLLKMITGLSLLFNRFAALTLVLFAPVSINMVLFHVFLDINGIAPSLVILLLQLFLMVKYFEVYKPLLKARMTGTDRTVTSGNDTAANTAFKSR